MSIRMRIPEEVEIETMILAFQGIANANNIIIQSCAENLLDKYGVEKGKCVDDGLMNDLFGMNLKVPTQNDRVGCGCVESVDIGAYNSCKHDCVYCYANYSFSTVSKNTHAHNSNSLMLIGEQDISDEVSFKKIKKYRKEIMKVTFFD